MLSTYAGVQQVDRGLIQAARDLGANRRQIQLKVVLPAAIPHIFNGLHLGMGVAIILVIAAEMIGGSSQTGMGFLLINAGQVMDTDRVFASLVVMAVAGAAIIKLQRFIDRKAAPWAVVTGHNRANPRGHQMLRILLATTSCVSRPSMPHRRTANDLIHVGEGPFISGGPFFIARDKGYFAKLGIDVDTRIFMDGALAVPEWSPASSTSHW